MISKGKLLTGLWGLYVLLVMLLYQADFRTSLITMRYTDPIDSDVMAGSSGKHIYYYTLTGVQGTLIQTMKDKLGTEKVISTSKVR